MSPYNWLSVLLISSMLLIEPANAQPEEKKGMPLTCLQWGEVPTTKLFYRDGKSALPLVLVKGRRSVTHYQQSKGSFEVYKREPDENDELKPVLMGRCDYPPSAKRMMFVIKSAAEESELPLKVLPIEDSFTTFPPGSFRFVNYSKSPLRINIGDKNELLQRKQIKVVRPTMPADGGLVSMVAYNNRGEAVFGRRLFGQSRDRKMVVFTDDTKHQVTALIVADIVSAAREKSESAR